MQQHIRSRTCWVGSCGWHGRQASVSLGVWQRAPASVGSHGRRWGKRRAESVAPPPLIHAGMHPATGAEGAAPSHEPGGTALCTGVVDQAGVRPRQSWCASLCSSCGGACRAWPVAREGIPGGAHGFAVPYGLIGRHAGGRDLTPRVGLCQRNALPTHPAPAQPRHVSAGGPSTGTKSSTCVSSGRAPRQAMAAESQRGVQQVRGPLTVVGIGKRDLASSAEEEAPCPAGSPLTHPALALLCCCADHG